MSERMEQLTAWIAGRQTVVARHIKGVQDNERLLRMAGNDQTSRIVIQASIERHKTAIARTQTELTLLRIERIELHLGVEK